MHVAPGPYHADGPGTRLYIPFGRLSSTHVERKMATPKYKLIYFDGRGRMEVIRLALEYSGIPYEDQRLAKPDWLAIKASGRFPFNQLPILEVDGKITLAQSISILRYVSKEAGLYPTDPLEAAKVDMIIDGLSDVRPHLRDIFFESDPAKKEELRKKAYEEVLPVQLAFFEKLLESNDGGNGYFVGSKMTCADLHFFAMMNNWLSYGKLEVPEPIQGFPLLSGLFSRVMNDPKIMAWLKKRPQTPL